MSNKDYLYKSELPLISVITVVLNRVNYIEQTILSVVNQTYKNIEYIIIDGGSTDGTIEIIKKYEDRIDYWISEKDEGMYYALNKGIKLAKGELIGICHSDDYYYSNDVLESLAKLHKIAEADVYHGDAVCLMDTSGEKKMINIFSNADLVMKTHNSIVHPTTFISKEAFNRFGLYETKYKSASDYELMVRLKKNGCKFHHIGKVVSCIRVNVEGRISNNCNGHLEVYSIQKQYKTGYHNRYLITYLYCQLKRIAKRLNIIH